MSQQKSNLNQLRTLLVLLREPNLSRASEILGLTQPTLSATLKQLRKTFNDPLLVRVGKNTELTAKAKQLIGPLEKVFEAVDMLWHVESPDPQHFSRRFLIGTTDYGTTLVAPLATKSLAKSAPGIMLQFVDAPEHMPAIRRENEIDFYLVPDAICNSPSFQGMKFIPLFEDKLVYLVHAKHRLASKKVINERDLHAELFASYHVGLERYSMAARKLMTLIEENRTIGLKVQQFSLLPLIAEETQCVTIIPERLAHKLQDKFHCKIIGDAQPSISFTFCLMWDPLHQSDPAHRFVKDVLRNLFAVTSEEHDQAESGAPH
jgi:DNA-binding transcriptional LysR family regulator